MSSIKGISPTQTITNYKDSESTMIRKVIRNSWNNNYVSGVVNGRKRIASEFKTINNITDFLSRKDCACGNIPNPTQPNKVAWRSRIGSIIKHCDDSNIDCANSNTKFIPDSSDYTTYKKQRSFNQNYNDISNGGDNNASQVSMRSHF